MLQCWPRSRKGLRTHEIHKNPQNTRDQNKTLSEAPEGMTFIRRKKTRVLHFVKEGYANVMVCGRMIGQQHVGPEHAAFGHVRFDTQVCRQRRRDVVKVI